MTSNNKYKAVFIRMTEGERDLLKRQAKRNGMSVNQYVKKKLGMFYKLKEYEDEYQDLER